MCPVRSSMILFVLLVLTFIAAANAQEGREATPSPCVVVKRMTTARQTMVDIFGRYHFDFVEGQLPPKIKFHSILRDKDIRAIQKQGGKVIILEPNYRPDELRVALARKLATNAHPNKV